MRWRAGVRGAHRSSASRKLVPASAPLRRRLATAPPACKGSAREGAAISAIGLSGSGRKWVLGSSSSGAMASGDRQGQWQLCLAVFIDASSISTTRTKNVFELSLIIPCRPAGARARAPPTHQLQLSSSAVRHWDSNFMDQSIPRVRRWRRERERRACSVLLSLT